jgi:hypothetical protein
VKRDDGAEPVLGLKRGIMQERKAERRRMSLDSARRAIERVAVAAAFGVNFDVVFQQHIVVPRRAVLCRVAERPPVVASIPDASEDLGRVIVYVAADDFSIVARRVLVWITDFITAVDDHP